MNSSSRPSVDIKRITTSDDLKRIAGSIVGSEWGDDNEMSDYDEAALREYIGLPENILLVAYDGDRPVGLALATKILKPHGRHWLFVDEVDVHPDYRRQSIGRIMMEALKAIAKEWGLDEVWVGTEPDNMAANHLYQSLHPVEVEQFVGYTYKTALSSVRTSN